MSHRTTCLFDVTRVCWQNDTISETFLDMFSKKINIKCSTCRLTWQKHIFTKRKQLGLQLHRMYWIIGRKSKLSLENKLLIYKTILKPIWTYGSPLWGTGGNFNIEILRRFQNKVLRSIANAPRYVPNTIPHTDLQIRTVKAEITNLSTKYR